MDTVKTEQHGRVTVVSIDRPEVRNAVDGATATALAAAFRRFDEDPGSDVDPGIIREIDPSLGDLLTTKDNLPDFTARFRGEYDWGHFQAAGILRARNSRRRGTSSGGSSV